MNRALAASLALLSPMLACAQSSVTVFGVLDTNLTYAKVGSTSVKLESVNGVSPSRLGFRGVEDIGGGLSAGFWLETALSADTGTQTGGAFWSRRATLSLASQTLGELRLGRDYTPTFWNHTYYSPFTTNGVAGSVNVVKGWPNGFGNAKTQGRDSNLVEYYTPRDLGGFYGQVQVAPGENVDGMKLWGVRVGYGSGPYDIALAYSSTDSNGSKFKQMALGGTYDFSVVKLYANVFSQKLIAQKQVVSMVGLSAPIGAGVFKVGYSYANMSGPGVDADDARMAGIGYNHFLSKRTQLYATYSRITNKGKASFVTADLPGGVPGQNAQGAQAGINHVF